MEQNKVEVASKAIGEALETFSNEEWISKNFEGAEVLSMKLDINSKISKGEISNSIEIKAYGTKRDEEILNKFDLSHQKQGKFDHLSPRLFFRTELFKLCLKTD